MIRPCEKCGSAMKMTEREQSGIQILRLECQCGNHGGTVFYRKPEDRERTVQAVIDGWNLAS